MRMPGFSAERSLSRRGWRYRGRGPRGWTAFQEVVSQLSRESAQQVRNQMGFGGVLCYPQCLQWGSCGYDPGGGMCCNNWGENCYWWPTPAVAD